MRPNRPAPLLAVGDMKTYAIKQPRQTHTRPASCAEAGCLPHRKGWVTTVPRGSELVDMVLSLRGRYRFREVESGDPATRRFEFEPGQPCLRADTHRVTLERPANFLVVAGDHRARLGLIRKHNNADDWAEDFAEHQDRVAHTLEGRP